MVLKSTKQDAGGGLGINAIPINSLGNIRMKSQLFKCYFYEEIRNWCRLNDESYRGLSQ